jgi:hypothetical protein
MYIHNSFRQQFDTGWSSKIYVLVVYLGYVPKRKKSRRDRFGERALETGIGPLVQIQFLPIVNLSSNIVGHSSVLVEIQKFC